MNMLVVAATESEVGILKDYLRKAPAIGIPPSILVTGVGCVPTACNVSRALAQGHYDFVLQAGVGGTFDPSIPLGSLVEVISDRYGDVGAEDHDNYLDIFDMGLIKKDEFPYTNGRLCVPDHPFRETWALRQATGLTISTVSGSEHTIARRRKMYNCQVESMEGAAFHFACLQQGGAFAHVRAISNEVMPRDKSKWQMKEAILLLNNWLISFIERYNAH